PPGVVIFAEDPHPQKAKATKPATIMGKPKFRIVLHQVLGVRRIAGNFLRRREGCRTPLTQNGARAPVIQKIPGLAPEGANGGNTGKVFIKTC
ncbi:MAG: hypothetical protein KDI06_06525, partial [Calditrichaeota bacterium]|nr:hypothetical protein [Calditrichota bacterium]